MVIWDLMQDVEDLHKIIDERRIKIVYQPLISLSSGENIGYEALSRGPENSRLASPNVLFPLAENAGLLYPLEKICREQAILGLPKISDTEKLFLNINPQVINDPNFASGITLELLKKIGLLPKNVVFEITERTSIKDFVSFEKTLQHYREQGFLIAIDDAGAGYSSLQAIAELKPDFIKIDISLIKDIDKNEVKQSLLETFNVFAKKINAKIIAEGIETAEELQELVEMGIDYGQGYFLARPAYPIPQISPQAKELISNYEKILKQKVSNYTEVIGQISQKVQMFNDRTSVNQIYELFEEDPFMEGLIIGENSIPYGLIMRNKLYNHLSTQYGIALYKNRSIKSIMDMNPLIVNYSMSVEMVAQHATSRVTQKLYDCIIVIEGGEFSGMVSVRTLLEYISNMQIECARYANPLTGLPGNLNIQNQLKNLVKQDTYYAVIYLDLDNFKAYNDKYGFERGDLAILFTSEVIKRAMKACICKNEFLGHIGGDDFIIIVKNNEQADCVCNEIIKIFDNEIITLYDETDRKKGGINAVSRTDELMFYPFMTVSLAVVENLRYHFDNHLRIGEVAAELKKLAKSKTGSNYVKNKRS